MRFWRRLHECHFAVRLLAKFAILLVACVAALYPKFWLLPTWLGRISDMNAVLQPSASGLDSLESEVRAAMPPGANAEEALKCVQAVVYARVPYAWDWEVWGVMDYLPTVTEVLEQGREDCDGRAVLAASLLRRMGYDAWLVSDFTHTWVATAYGETMSPGKSPKGLVATDDGTQAVVSLATASSAGNALLYGIRVFPLWRELTLLSAVCVVLVQPRSGILRRSAGCILLVLGLMALRWHAWPDTLPRVQDGQAVLGLGMLTAGCAALMFRGADRRSVQEPRE